MHYFMGFASILLKLSVFCKAPDHDRDKSDRICGKTAVNESIESPKYSSRKNDDYEFYRVTQIKEKLLFLASEFKQDYKQDSGCEIEYLSEDSGCNIGRNIRLEVGVEYIENKRRDKRASAKRDDTESEDSYAGISPKLFGESAVIFYQIADNE